MKYRKYFDQGSGGGAPPGIVQGGAGTGGTPQQTPQGTTAGGTPEPLAGDNTVHMNTQEGQEVRNLLHNLRQTVAQEGKTDQEKELEVGRMLTDVLGRMAGAQRQVQFMQPTIDRVRDVPRGIGMDQLIHRKTTDPLVREWQRASDNAYLVHSWMRTMDHYHGTGYMMAGGVRTLDLYQKELAPLTRDLNLALRATTNPMNTTTATEGPEWIPTGFSNEMWEFYRLQLSVAALFREDNMPTNPYKKPIITTRPKARKGTEITGKPANIYAGAAMSNPGTGATTFDATRFYCWMSATGQLKAEAVVDMLDELREEIAMAMRDAREDGILNGDTAGTHMDTDTAAAGADDIRKTWLGLRGYALDVGATVQNAVSAVDSVAAFDALRAKMGKFGIRPSELAYIVSLASYINLIKDTNVTTFEKYGSAATILTGELAKIRGVPIIVSEFQREDLNVLGVNDGVTTDNTTSILVNRTQFRWGKFDTMTLEPFRDPFNNLDSLIAAEFADFRARELATAAPTFCALNRDVTS